MSAPYSDELDSALIDIAAAGDNTVVAGVAGKSVRVYALEFMCNAAVGVTIKDGASLTLVPTMNFQAGGAKVLDRQTEQPRPWYITSPGNGFVINLSGAVQVSGRVWYVLY